MPKRSQGQNELGRASISRLIESRDHALKMAERYAEYQKYPASKPTEPCTIKSRIYRKKYLDLAQSIERQIAKLDK
jgi:hypothetical protein